MDNINQKGIINYSLMVLAQWKVWDLLKNYIVKLNLMYLKSIYIYIVSFSIYEGQSKITEPYLITFKFGIVDNKCDYFL